jgi:hypothetical protein
MTGRWVWRHRVARLEDEAEAQAEFVRNYAHGTPGLTGLVIMLALLMAALVIADPKDTFSNAVITIDKAGNVTVARRIWLFQPKPEARSQSRMATLRTDPRLLPRRRQVLVTQGREDAEAR